jgi:hypothetical protein
LDIEVDESPPWPGKGRPETEMERSERRYLAGFRDTPCRVYSMRVPQFDIAGLVDSEAAGAPAATYDQIVADLVRQATNARTNQGRILCINLLGELRAKRAVPVILAAIENLPAGPEPGFAEGPALLGHAALEALASIGSPAVSPVVNALGKETNGARRRLLAAVLSDILGRDVAEFVLQKAHDGAAKTEKTNYEEASAALKAEK